MRKRNDCARGERPLDELGTIEFMNALDELSYRWLPRLIHLPHSNSKELLLHICSPFGKDLGS